jgi:glutathione S-transferase
MLKLYQLAGCPYALRTRIVLGEKKLPFESIFIDRKNKPREVLEVSPSGGTPVIDDGETKLRDSATINEYLDERHPEPPLMPRSPKDRAEVRLAIEDMDDLLEAMFDLFIAKRDGEDVSEATAAFEEQLGSWDARLSKSPYVAGSEFSLADVTLWSHLAAMESQLSPWKNVSTWFARVGERSAVQQARAANQG